ncbi:hypothetical protein F4677DRAFT_449830 [Hypoxylon crocopeplum]|nr:hypothetical protein F4677DRAFT_449830 [Hypoxylon crocopeplum]
MSSRSSWIGYYWCRDAIGVSTDESIKAASCGLAATHGPPWALFLLPNPRQSGPAARHAMKIAYGVGGLGLGLGLVLVLVLGREGKGNLARMHETPRDWEDLG